MKILSIDVGIKNLAFCLIESDNNNIIIHKWDVINLCNTYLCKICQKKAKYNKLSDYYCKTHAKTSEFEIPTSEQNINKIKKLKINELYVLAFSLNIEYSKPILKNALVEKIKEYIKNKYLENIIEDKADGINLITLGITMRDKLDSVLNLDNVDKIIIENQISTIATRMKTLQGMIAQYFIMKNKTDIEFISSTNKLKLFIGNKKTTYNERKKLSIKISNTIFNKKQIYTDWQKFMNTHTKKDDLADCFLQGIYYLNELDTINDIKDIGDIGDIGNIGNIGDIGDIGKKLK